MTFRSFLGAAAAVALATQASAADLGAKAPAPAAPAPYFLFADTQISYSFYTRAKEPAINGPIQKHVVSLTHFDVTRWGTNFVNIDFLKSNHFDPANGGRDGALEVYGLYRGTLSGNYLAGSKAFAIGGIVKDVSLAFGFDANTKNTYFAPQKRLIVGGVQVAFDVPGYLTISALAGKEWNHCGLTVAPIDFCVGPGRTSDPSFDVNAHIEIGYMQPLAFTGLPLRFSGFTNIVTPKGRNGDGTKTKTEVLSDNRLTLDVGKVAFNKPNTVDAFVGYRYWLNKFGNDSKLPFAGGTIENQIYVGAAFHI